MEENNRINRRSRPRPYDLRRKVLLKNFLREQMTYIPETQNISVSQNDEANDLEKSEISLDLDEDLQEMNDENKSSVVMVDEQCCSDSSVNLDANNVNLYLKDDDDENAKNSVSDTNESSLFKLASLLKFKKESKKKKKGIVKAKDTIKSSMKTRSFKTGVEPMFPSPKKPSESSMPNTKFVKPQRSLFSLFKSRRAQRKANAIDRKKKSPNSDKKSLGGRTKYVATNQSVQTEDTWIREELLKVQQSNKLLREENRLLSESLSYFMSNTSVDSNYCSSPLQSSNKNTFTMSDHNYLPSSSTCNWNPRTRVTRSKSVQEQNERRNLLRNSYRTRSMNCHNVRNTFLLPDPKPPLPSCTAQSDRYNSPRVRRKTLINLPLNSNVRGIQRRSSMPERILSENDRSVAYRRSGSFHGTYNRKPFHSLPSEAFF